MDHYYGAFKVASLRVHLTIISTGMDGILVFMVQLRIY
jgi:hypothetical protein